jgi:hypothetical protein
MTKRLLLLVLVFALPLVLAQESEGPRTVQFLLIPAESRWVNFVMPADSFAVPAHELIRQNPQIRGIIYYNSTLQRYIPYLNIGKGVGKRFMVEPGMGYKILVRSPILLQVDEVTS